MIIIIVVVKEQIHTFTGPISLQYSKIYALVLDVKNRISHTHPTSPKHLDCVMKCICLDLQCYKMINRTF